MWEQMIQALRFGNLHKSSRDMLKLVKMHEGKHAEESQKEEKYFGAGKILA